MTYSLGFDSSRRWATVSLAALSLVALLGGCQSRVETVNAPSGADGMKSAALESRVVAPVLWNDSWQFFRSDKVLTLADAQAQGEWQAVSLPHTANIEPRVVNDQWQGDAWYQKSFQLADAWQNKTVLLDFEAAMNVSEVWLNGNKLSRHLGGYLPFTVDLTDSLQPGENRLMVRLDNRDNAVTGPKPLNILDFNMYGGLYRNVWLRLENSVRISDPVAAGKTASGGIFVTYPHVDAQRATVNVQTHLVNTADDAPLLLRQQLLRSGKVMAVVEKRLNLAANSDTEVQQQLVVARPALWSPGSPNLYTLKTQVLTNNLLVEEQQTPVGIRKFELIHNQLYINGEKTFLRGVNRHQEYPYAGYALSDAAQYRDAEKIKAAGFDYVRLSHYPHSKAFMRAADELGLVLLDAILGWQYVNDTPAFYDHAVQTCRDLIRRDRNHPSVLAWECSLNESQMPQSLIDRLHQTVHEEFPGSSTYSAGWVPQTYDIYLQARQHRIGHYQEPEKPYVVSEYGDWEYYAMNAGLNQDSWSNLLQEERSSRQLLGAGEKRLQQQAANITEAHDDNFNTPAFADGYWVMFDYNRGYADDIESSGIMSLERLPKFSYFFYQSQRDADEFGGPLAKGYMAHIASYWQADSSLSFYVYSNADEVELLLNGRSLGKGVPDTGRYPNLAHPPFLFELDKFEPGTLEALAKVDGKVVARHQVTTPGKPVSVSLALDTGSVAPEAGRNDLLFVYATLVDAEGNPTRVTGEKITFSVAGDASLVSPATLETEAGIAAALIRIGDKLDTVRVEARYQQSEANALTF